MKFLPNIRLDIFFHYATLRYDIYVYQTLNNGIGYILNTSMQL